VPFKKKKKDLKLLQENTGKNPPKYIGIGKNFLGLTTLSPGIRV
jgi:hypothetical protein